MRDHDGDEEVFSTDLSSFIKLVSYLCVVAVLLFALFLMLSLFRISSYAFSSYDSLDEVPHNRVGLLLGTSAREISGQPNDYFTNRIAAATELYNARKVDYILVSGDNRHESYNEPREMRRALLKAGVPADRIIFDFAGISTLDSVIRANKVFLQQRFTVISQRFHNERALFIADNNGIQAVGFNALTPDYGLFSKVNIRELFARVKCVLDVYFLNTQPRFLGEPIIIGSTPMPKSASNKPRRPTSKIKYPTASARTLREDEALDKVRLIAKKPANSALYQKHIEFLQDNSKSTEELFTNAEDQRLQERFMAEEQQRALEDSSAAAAESLSLPLIDAADLPDDGGMKVLPPPVPAEDRHAAEAAAAGSPVPAPGDSPPDGENNRTSASGDPRNSSASENGGRGSPRRQRRIRTDINTFNGDPWDYE